VGTEHAVGNDSESGEIIHASYVIFGPGSVDVNATEALSAVNENKSPGRSGQKVLTRDPRQPSGR
jgi:hypothetical protein